MKPFYADKKIVLLCASALWLPIVLSQDIGPAYTSEEAADANGFQEQVVSADEYLVYHDALVGLFGPIPEDAQFIIYSHTGIDREDAFDEQSAESFTEETGEALSEEMITYFQEINQHPVLLENKFAAKFLADVLAPEDERTLLNAGDKWAHLYRCYPHAYGLIRFSRIAYTSDGRGAFLYVSIQSDWVTGRGYYVLLKKSGVRWGVAASSVVWKS